MQLYVLLKTANYYAFEKTIEVVSIFFGRKKKVGIASKEILNNIRFIITCSKFLWSSSIFFCKAAFTFLSSRFLSSCWDNSNNAATWIQIKTYKYNLSMLKASKKYSSQPSRVTPRQGLQRHHTFQEHLELAIWDHWSATSEEDWNYTHNTHISKKRGQTKQDYGSVFRLARTCLSDWSWIGISTNVYISAFTLIKFLVLYWGGSQMTFFST